MERQAARVSTAAAPPAPFGDQLLPGARSPAPAQARCVRFPAGWLRHLRPGSAAPLTLLQLTDVQMVSLGLTDVWIIFSSANASICLLRRQEKCYRERDGGSEPPVTRGLAWPEEETSLPSWNPGLSGRRGSETTAELHPSPRLNCSVGLGQASGGVTGGELNVIQKRLPICLYEVMCLQLPDSCSGGWSPTPPGDPLPWLGCPELGWVAAPYHLCPVQARLFALP